MKNTYEEAVLKVVMWWSDKSFRTPLNQDNGDKTKQGDMTNMLLSGASLKAQQTITEEKIKKFEEKLTELLMKAANRRERELDVDYSPCNTLYEAAKHAGIDSHCFPVKSFTSIEDDNRVFAKYQYGRSPVEI